MLKRFINIYEIQASIHWWDKSNTNGNVTWEINVVTGILRATIFFMTIFIPSRILYIIHIRPSKRLFTSKTHDRNTHIFFSYKK